MNIQLKGDYILYVLDEGSYQWYFDGSLIEGANEKWYHADKNTNINFQCMVVTNNVCEIMSYPYNFNVVTEQKSTGIKLYPNPATNSLTIKIPKDIGEKKGTFKIIKMSGEVMFNIPVEINEFEKQIDINGIGEGAYVWLYIYGDQILQGKFIKAVGSQ